MSFAGPIELIWCGQSNALGTNVGAYPPPYSNTTDRSDILAVKNTTIGATSVVQPWGNLRPNQPAGNNWTGPDMPCSIDLTDDFGKVGVHIIMRAKGSTALAVEWLPTDAAVAPGEDWRTLRDLVAATRAAQPTETANARPWVVWIQGEQDANDVTEAGNYETNLRESCKQWVRYFGPGTRIIIVYLHDDCTRPFRATVRAAEEAIVAEWEGRAFGLDPTPLCTVAGDGIHYDDQGLAVGKALGALIAGENP